MPIVPVLVVPMRTMRAVVSVQCIRLGTVLGVAGGMTAMAVLAAVGTVPFDRAGSSTGRA